MLKQILEFLLHLGWKNVDGYFLGKSQIYNAETHISSVIWELGRDKFTLENISEVNLNFDLQTFVIWTHED